MMSLEEIMLKYEAETLDAEDDASLHAAVLTLEQAEKSFFSDQDISTWSVIELRMGQAAKHKLIQAENFILKLLLTRYGCND